MKVCYILESCNLIGSKAMRERNQNSVGGEVGLDDKWTRLLID